LGYTFDGFIYPATNWWPPHLPAYPRVGLLGEPPLVFVPLAGSLQEGFRGRDDEPVLGMFDLTEMIRSFGEQLSAGGPVAYVFAEGSAGGTQSSIVWDHGRIVLGPLQTADNDADACDGFVRERTHSDAAVNQALRHLGVRPVRGDEFGAVGLSRHRSNDEFLGWHS
jgi:hypothetical protein